MSAYSERVSYSEHSPFCDKYWQYGIFHLTYGVMFLCKNTACFCNRQLKIADRFVIKFLFLVLNCVKVTIFRCFSFSRTLFSVS